MFDKIIRKNIFFGFIIKGLGMAISFALIPIVLGYLGKEKYGIWAVILSITQWFVFFDFGMGNGLRNKLTKSIAEKNYKEGNLYINTTYFITSIIFIGLYILFFIASFFLNWSKILNLPLSFDENILLFVQVVFGFIFMRFIFQLLKNIFYAFQMPALASFVEIIAQGLILITIIFFVRSNDNSMFKVGVIFTSIPLIVFFFATILYFKYSENLIFSYKLIDLKYAKPLFKLGAGFLLLQLSAIFLNTTTIFLINFFIGPEKTTEYSIAIKYISILMIVSTIFFKPYWSAVTDAYNRKDYVWIKKMLRKNTIIASIIALFCLVLAVISPFVYDLWIKGTLVSFNVTLWAAIYIAIFIFTQPVLTFINGTGKIKQQTRFSIIIILSLVPIEIVLFKYTSMRIEAFIIPPIIFRLVRTIFGWLQLNNLLKFNKA